MSLLIALAEPAPAVPPVAPPAVVAEALPEPAPCALSRVPLGSILSLLMALEEPAPAGPPVAPPAAVASPELAPCASWPSHRGIAGLWSRSMRVVHLPPAKVYAPCFRTKLRIAPRWQHASALVRLAPRGTS